MSKKCDLTGIKRMTGFNVPKSRKRTKRTFLPNLKKTSLKSEALGIDLALKITADVLRTINKYGGLDSFLVNSKQNKLTDNAKQLKKKITKSLTKDNKLDTVKVINKSKVKKSKLENKRKVKKATNKAKENK